MNKPLESPSNPVILSLIDKRNSADVGMGQGSVRGVIYTVYSDEEKPTSLV